MVQRKVPNKLGIQTDHVKSEKRFGSLKPSYCQHQDGKTKGTDLKKKMKKSRSIKLSDIESLRSTSPLRKTIAQPGKPPPLNVPTFAATPQKKSLIKAVDGSPNYMKCTSSSKAKKESSQASFLNTQTDSDSKNLSRRSSTGSKISSGSCNKPARTLTRTSSLKLVRRTLTKSPTFKPVRASAKKCSRVALCTTDMNVMRATCSSTLKDSKFPSYLMLNPGTEGTSIIKVCPYTYCSLNGHHHTPLPPLKCFLKARRRSMKTQRSMKMEALSLRRLKPYGDGTEEFDHEQVVSGNEPASNGVDLGISPMSPLMQGGAMDFFIEIYAKSKGNDAEATQGSTQMNAKGMDSESLSEGSPHSDIDFNENLEHCGEIISKVDIKETLHEGILIKEESSPWNFTDGDKQEGVSSVDVDHTTFEIIDMEWEEWQFSASEPGYEAHSSMESDNESDLRDELKISSDESDSNIAKEILADGAEQVFEEDNAYIDTCSQVSEALCYNQVSSIEEMFEVLVAMEEEVENIETDLIGIVTTTSSRKELYEEPTSGKEKMLENGVPGTVNDVSEADSPLEVPENSCTIDLKDEAFESTEQFQLHSFDKLEQDATNEDYNVIRKPEDSEADQTVTISDCCPDKELPSGEAGRVGDAELLIGIHDSSHVLPGADEDDIEVELEDNQNNQLFEVNNAIDESFSTQDTVDESLFAESQDHLSDSQHKNTHVVYNQSVLKEDQDEVKFKVPTSMDSEEQNHSRMHKTSLAKGSEEVGKMELEDNASHKPRSKFSFTRSNAKEELPDNHNNRKWTIGSKRHEENNEEPGKFNPREPNFLPVVPEPDAEKVDLRHQMIDERKNAEEWMLDHALQQAVTKLAPARKRKVALLVEAFETVLPITKCETHLRHTSTGFAHGRPIQACN